MLPDSAYPGPLPLRAEAALDLLSRLDEFAGAVGAFLTFVIVPVAEREGEYRFAGASRSLAEAIRRVDEFGGRFFSPGRPVGVLRLLLEDCGVAYDDKGAPLADSSYVYHLPAGEPHRLVLATEYGAPYEGLGAFVVELSTLAGSAYEHREPETAWPAEWADLEGNEAAEQQLEAAPPPTTQGPGPAEDIPF